MDEITGGTPYGASTLAGSDGSRQPSENELAIARFQGKHVAKIAAKLAATPSARPSSQSSWSCSARPSTSLPEARWLAQGNSWMVGPSPTMTVLLLGTRDGLAVGGDQKPTSRRACSTVASTGASPQAAA